MTVILLSQNLTPHSRLGNNLAWMARLSPVLDNLGIAVSYPWGRENFRDYFPLSSKWVGVSDYAQEIFKDIFNEELTTSSLSQVVRAMELGEGCQSISEDCGHHTIVRTLTDQSILFMTGAVEIANNQMFSLFQKFKMVILHEPYEFVYNSRESSYAEDYSVCAPRSSLLDEQRLYIQSITGAFKTEGLHIRRGDYARWQSGAYFYDDDFWISEVNRSLRDGFAPWIFSNELSNNLHSLLRASGAIISDGGFVDDFIRLMLMDQISGPPSTFTLMAAKVSASSIGTAPRINFFKPRL